MQPTRILEGFHVSGRLRHGTLWSRGLALAEAEIGRGPAPSGRWDRRTRSAESGRPGGVRAGEAVPVDRGEPMVERETWAAQAA